jgi:hypothetical protein
MATARKIIGSKGLHIEAEGCIVNITENLIDIKGRRVTSIQIIPDKYAGEKPWKRIGGCANIRIIEMKSKKS